MIALAKDAQPPIDSDPYAFVRYRGGVAVADAPGVTFGLHLCRGNNKGYYVGEGGYDSIAPQVFKRAGNFARFLLEYDDWRSGSFEPLRHLPKGKRVVLGLVSAMQEVASEQRAILAAALWQKFFGPGQLAALQAAQSAQQSDQASFDIAASVQQQQLWNTSINKSFVYQANSEELQAISLQDNQQSLATDPISPAG